MIVFVHGAGRAGVAAWPTIRRPDAVLLNLRQADSVANQAVLVAEAMDDDAVVVAHSHGAIAALMALRTAKQRMRSLVLIEPALYDIARGDPAVEHHISAMEHARREHDTRGLEGYWRVVRPLMFGGDFDADRWEDERGLAEQFHRIPPPWGHGISASEIIGMPTIVLTGGWNDEYEAIAGVLATRGAKHVVLSGARHRPQDLDAFRTLLEEVAAR